MATEVKNLDRELCVIPPLNVRSAKIRNSQHT